MESRDHDYEDLYSRVGGDLWRAMLLFTGNPETASDVVSEVFVQLIRRGRAVRDPASWVWRSAFKVAKGEMKRHGAAASAASLEDVTEPERTDELRSLIEIVGHLPRKQREAVVLYYAIGYSQQEIGDLLGISASSVGVHLHRARLSLKETLGGESDV